MKVNLINDEDEDIRSHTNGLKPFKRTIDQTTTKHAPLTFKGKIELLNNYKLTRAATPKTNHQMKYAYESTTAVHVRRVVMTGLAAFELLLKAGVI